MTAPRRVLMTAGAVVCCLGLLTACQDQPAPDPTATGGEVAVAEFEELSGFDVPEHATDVVVEPVPESSIGALRARFTIPETEVGTFCGTPLAVSGPLSDEDRTTFALPDDLPDEQVQDCESMREGSDVSRRVIIVPAGQGRVRLHVVAFEMPR